MDVSRDSSSLMSILLRCFLMPERRSMLWPGEKRENSPAMELVMDLPPTGYAHEFVFLSRALSGDLGWCRVFSWL